MINNINKLNFIKARNISDEYLIMKIYENFEKRNDIIKQIFKSHKSLHLTQKAI